MKVIGKRDLARFVKKHAQAVIPVKGWLAEASEASWKTTQDIKNRYATASFLSGNRVVFNVGGNKYRLVVKIAYGVGVVYVEWIGTHGEYDRKTF